MRTITLGELFTDAEIALAAKLYKQFKGTGLFAAECEAQVVGPALPRINQVTGQENNARYWACWRYEIVNGRQTKVPYRPDGQYKADVNNPSTWGTFTQACSTASGPTMHGIGMVLTEHDPYTGIDDDKPENPASEQEREVQRRVLDAFQSYTERSVGGNGYHIIIRGKVAGGRDRGHIGVYSTQRYLTFTGDVVRNAPIADFQQYLDALVAGMPGGDTVAAECARLIALGDTP